MVNNKIYILIGMALIAVMLIFLGVSTRAGTLDTAFIDKNYTKVLNPDLSPFIQEDFNPTYGAITLTDTKIIDGKSTGKLAEYSLTYNTELCIINCEAQGKVTLYQDGTIFDDIKFKTLLGDDTNIKSYKYLLFNGYQDNYIDVPVYIEVCKDVIANETTKNYTKGDIIKVCSQEIDHYDSVNQPVEIWNKYNHEVLKAGDYRWKITGVKDKEQSVDFVLVRDSKEFGEWATWNSSFNVGLYSYYKLDRNTSTITPDVYSINNGTLMGGVDVVSGGAINNSLNFSSARLGTMNISNEANYDTLLGITTGNPFTVNLWYYQVPAGDIATRGIFCKGVTGQQFLCLGKDDQTAASQKLKFYDYQSAGSYRAWLTTNAVVQNNQWMMATLVFNGTQSDASMFLYINGTLVPWTVAYSSGGFPTSISNNVPVSLGRNYDPTLETQYWNGKIDELGIWNRTLSASEISDLYNSGNGISYIEPTILNIIGKVVTSTGSNIANATILILNSIGTLIANTTSNATGDWTYSFYNGTLTNYTIVGYNPYNISQGGNAYPFFNA